MRTWRGGRNILLSVAVIVLFLAGWFWANPFTRTGPAEATATAVVPPTPTLTATSTTTPTPTLTPTKIPDKVRIRGEVVDEEGIRIPYGEVTVRIAPVGTVQPPKQYTTTILGGRYEIEVPPGMGFVEFTAKGYHPDYSPGTRFVLGEPYVIDQKLAALEAPPPQRRGDDIVQGGVDSRTYANRSLAVASGLGRQGILVSPTDILQVDDVSLSGSFQTNFVRSDGSVASGSRPFIGVSGVKVTLKNGQVFFLDGNCVNLLIPVEKAFLKVTKFIDETPDGVQKFVQRSGWQFRIRTVDPDLGFDRFVVTGDAGEVIFEAPREWFAEGRSSVVVEVSEDVNQLGAGRFRAVLKGTRQLAVLKPGLVEQLEFFNVTTAPPPPPPPPAAPTSTPVPPVGPTPTPVPPVGPTATPTPVPPGVPTPTHTPIPAAPTNTPTAPPSPTPRNPGDNRTPTKVVKTPVVPNPSPTEVATAQPTVPPPTPGVPPPPPPTAVPGPTNTPLP